MDNSPAPSIVEVRSGKEKVLGRLNLHEGLEGRDRQTLDICCSFRAIMSVRKESEQSQRGNDF
jgi:hypothetical protein